MTQPEFVDNRDGNTLAAAIAARLHHLAETLRHPVDLAIATGYFNPEGFARVADALETVGRIRWTAFGGSPAPRTPADSYLTIWPPARTELGNGPGAMFSTNGRGLLIPEISNPAWC